MLWKLRQISNDNIYLINRLCNTASKFLQNANTGVDEMLHTGVNTLESLRSQRITLKGAHRKNNGYGQYARIK
ncbi:hypothetical protein NQ314_013463 [Rhamnusium bicolor]|uniref:Uncharacterized protein n=1 Tax=Rhamnusium bicolor TaxID=1586634 RepID=A0AAV8X6Y6_9CUCU|nr:hypothetical protein NQ314_013463 [Rhamnusium bicolor]